MCDYVPEVNILGGVGDEHKEIKNRQKRLGERHPKGADESTVTDPGRNLERFMDRGAGWKGCS